MWGNFSASFVGKLGLRFASRVCHRFQAPPMLGCCSSCAYLRPGVREGFLSIPLPSSVGRRPYVRASGDISCLLSCPPLEVASGCFLHSVGWTWRVEAGGEALGFPTPISGLGKLCAPGGRQTTPPPVSAQGGFLPLSLWMAKSALYQGRILDLEGFLPSPCSDLASVHGEGVRFSTPTSGQRKFSCRHGKGWRCDDFLPLS